MSQSFSVVEKGNLVEFDSSLNLSEAKQYLAENMSYNSFAMDLVNKPASRLSEKQISWIQYLAHKDMNKQEEVEEEVVSEFLPLVQQMYQKVKSPGRKFTLRLPMTTVATVTKGANKGYLYVYDERNNYVGKISDKGVLMPSGYVSEDVKNILLEANENLFELAKIYGHETGNCSVCGRTLSDPLSIQMGIGPVCAKRFE